MDRRLDWAWGICAAAAAAGLVFRSDLAAAGVREGIALCLQTVIPSLFAFMVLSDLLAGGGGAVFAPFRLLARAYRLPEDAAPAIALGLTGGYPVGARMAAGLKKAGKLTAQQGAALLCCAFGPSPAFLCGIGEMVFGSRKVGLAIWGALAAGSLPVGWLAGRGLRPEANEAPPEAAAAGLPFSERLVGSVLSATRAMGVICGFTVAFAALRRYLLLLPGGWGKFAAAFCEVSVGCMSAGEEGYMAALILVTGCCCLGGVSVWMQNACFLKGSGIPMEKFFLSRVLHLFFSLSAVLLLERLFGMSGWAAESVFSSFAEAAPQMGAGSAVSSAFLMACCMLLLAGKGVSVRRK